MPQKDKATFVRILNKYLDPRWSDQDLADAVGVSQRSTANRWKDTGQPTMPQGETLDKLVQVIKVTDEADRPKIETLCTAIAAALRAYKGA